MTEAQHERDTANKDFFDRAVTTVKFRLSIKSRYPAMNVFIESVYKEDDKEVEADIERLKAIATDMHSKVELISGETGIFKAGVDPASVVALMEKYTEGVVYSWNNSHSIDNTMLEVSNCINLLKKSLC